VSATVHVVSPTPRDVTSGVQLLVPRRPDFVAGPNAPAGVFAVAAPQISTPPANLVSGAQPLAAPAVDPGARWSDEIGGESIAPLEPERPARLLDNQTIYRIVRAAALSLSGDALYSAVGADDQLGLLYGFVLFPQASKHLGSLLRLMRSRAEAAFLDTFGSASDELLAVTGAATPAERLRAVQGQFLWHEPWPSRFRRAGSIPEFQAAQNEEAIANQFHPVVLHALALGLSTERALAIAYDAVATRGVGGGLRWLVDTAGPLRTEQQRAHALRVLGFPDLASFQRTVTGLRADGAFGPDTHAALVGALRRQGDVPMPTASELVATLVEAAEGEHHERLERLEESELVTDDRVSA
jgi:hypothetical protein